jgi:hypothetical protein
MSRDHRKLNVFTLADELVIRVHAETATFPADQRFELRNQIRNVATGSAAETRYLLDLSARLEFLRTEVYRELEPKYRHLLARLMAHGFRLQAWNGRTRGKSYFPKAQSPKP